jgi:hypothetical protein
MYRMYSGANVSKQWSQPKSSPGLPCWDFATITFLQGWIVSRTPNPQPGGPGLCIYDPRIQGGPAMPPGTRYPFESPFTTCMGYSVTYLIPTTTRESGNTGHTYLFVLSCAQICSNATTARKSEALPNATSVFVVYQKTHSYAFQFQVCPDIFTILFIADFNLPTTLSVMK